MRNKYRKPLCCNKVLWSAVLVIFLIKKLQASKWFKQKRLSLLEEKKIVLTAELLYCKRRVLIRKKVVDSALLILKYM
jgi:hypothetical protein